jgi:hypothetical protein
MAPVLQVFDSLVVKFTQNVLEWIRANETEIFASLIAAPLISFVSPAPMPV